MPLGTKNLSCKSSTYNEKQPPASCPLSVHPKERDLYESSSVGRSSRRNESELGQSADLVNEGCNIFISYETQDHIAVSPHRPYMQRCQGENSESGLPNHVNNAKVKS
jgi:hypothetical protein